MPLFNVKRIEVATVTSRWIVEAEDEDDASNQVLDYGSLIATETSDHELCEEHITLIE